jgi:hypothetical protein
LFWNSSGLCFRVGGRKDWIRIGSCMVVIFLSGKSWFLIGWFVF